MCTVTYCPTAGGYILTHSRDEKLWRPIARQPQVYKNEFVYPLDVQGLGTWVLHYPKGTISLLNGGFSKHQPNPPYKKSRGLILREFTEAQYPDFDAYITHYALEGIEPFTLVSVCQSPQVELRIYVWDGERLHTLYKDPAVPLIWSAVTVYPPDIIQERKKWWQTWLNEHPNPSDEDILNFHLYGGNGNPRYNIKMIVPGEGQTVSISQIVHHACQRTFFYHDLLTGLQTKIVI